VADGTTSFHFQTRSALLRGATDRVVQLDVADFAAAMNEVKAARGDKAESSPASGRCPQLSQLAERSHAYRRRTGAVACTCPVRAADGRCPRS